MTEEQFAQVCKDQDSIEAEAMIGFQDTGLDSLLREKKAQNEVMCRTLEWHRSHSTMVTTELILTYIGRMFALNKTIAMRVNSVDDYVSAPSNALNQLRALLLEYEIIH